MCDGIVITGVHFKLKRSSFMSSIYWSFSSKTWPNTILILLWWKRPILSLPCVFQSHHTYLILKQYKEKENRKQFRARFYGYTWPHPLWSHSVGPNSSSHMLFFPVLGIRPEAAWGFSVFLFRFLLQAQLRLWGDRSSLHALPCSSTTFILVQPHLSEGPCT